jgi:response regulator RpfG family c-di-GMP phosphodiesterase
MAENRGTHFDPKVVDAFIRRKSDVIRVYLDYADICVFSDSRAQPNEI